MKRFNVATECPSCGALLDFTEGTNALKCLHCRSNLLVTGRKRVLSYFVPAKLTERFASALATKALRDLGLIEFRDVNLQLYYIPYYHMTGQDLTWEEAKPLEDYGEEDGYGGLSRYLMSGSYDDFRIEGTTDLIEAAGELFGNLTGKIFGRKTEVKAEPLSIKSLENIDKISAGYSTEMPQKIQAGYIPTTGRYLNGAIDLRDRYLDKNFLACDLLHGQGIYSLGVRPSVLRLQLFRKEALAEGAKAVQPDLSPANAEVVAMKHGLGPNHICRFVVGKVLSLVYFPFWIFNAETDGRRSLLIIDAVSKAVIKVDAPETLYTNLNREVRGEPEIADFRRLVCPNCGWDLPVRPDDCIYCCKSCKKAWLIAGSLLHEVPFTIAAVPEMKGKKNIQLLPFWVFRAGERDGKPFHVFIPAFRYRRLRFIIDLALVFTRHQPSYSFSEPGEEELSGGYYDIEDALIFARFARSALTAKNATMFGSFCTEDISASEALLTWFPFRIEGNSLQAPFCKLSITKNLII